MNETKFRRAWDERPSWSDLHKQGKNTMDYDRVKNILNRYLELMKQNSENEEMNYLIIQQNITYPDEIEMTTVKAEDWDKALENNWETLHKGAEWASLIIPLKNVKEFFSRRN